MMNRMFGLFPCCCRTADRLRAEDLTARGTRTSRPIPIQTSLLRYFTIFRSVLIGHLQVTQVGLRFYNVTFGSTALQPSELRANVPLFSRPHKGGSKQPNGPWHCPCSISMD